MIISDENNVIFDIEIEKIENFFAFNNALTTCVVHSKVLFKIT